MTGFFNPFAPIGRSVFAFLSIVGRVAMFIGLALSHIVRPPFYFQIFLSQLRRIAYDSLPVVGMTALFTGMVLALQSYTGFSRFQAESAIATVVVLSITRELGPVLAGLMVAGRVGAAIAAEIATMRVTEQVDALSTLSTNPYKYLIAPRVLAGVISMPLLVVIADIIGVMGGYIICIFVLNFNSTSFLRDTGTYLQVHDVTSGLLKSAVFGLIIALMGCYHGFNSQRGAQGVGHATTNAVVSASILILLSNYFLTQVLFAK